MATRMKCIPSILPLLLASGAFALEVPSTLLVDRTAIERVYYEHRTGSKPPFEDALPPALVRRMVEAELHKEYVLGAVYGVEITPAMVDAEVKRINATTRAPEMLAQIKKALGDDPARFARSLARPIVVERILRERFDNDDKLHAKPRQAMEVLRAKLLAAIKDGKKPSDLEMLARDGAKANAAQATEATWQLTSRPANDAAPPNNAIQPAAPTKVEASAGAYTVEATAQMAQVLSSPETENPDKEKLYFEDLPAAFQNVLKAQLRKPGNVSAVIEMPHGFVLCLARETTASTLGVLAVSLPKRSLEEWLAEQKEKSST